MPLFDEPTPTNKSFYLPNCWLFQKTIPRFFSKRKYVKTTHPLYEKFSMAGSEVKKVQRQPIKQTFRQMHNLLQVIIRKSAFILV